MPRKRKLQISGLCFGGLCLAFLTVLIASEVWAFRSFVSHANQSRFKAVWVGRLRQCHSLPQVKTLPQPKSGHLNTRVFPDGSWVAISWHCFHDEEDVPSGKWDGGVLRDSKGQMYWTPYHFCGDEGFSADFRNVPAKSLPQFYQKAGFPRTPVT